MQQKTIKNWKKAGNVKKIASKPKMAEKLTGKKMMITMLRII
jgi:hypothetical protein